MKAAPDVSRLTRQANMIAGSAGVRCAYTTERTPTGPEFVWLFYRGDTKVATTRQPGRVLSIAERLATGRPTVSLDALARSLVGPTADVDLIRHAAQNIKRLLNSRHAAQLIRSACESGHRGFQIAIRLKEGQGNQAANITSIGPIRVGKCVGEVVIEHFERLHGCLPKDGEGAKLA